MGLLDVFIGVPQSQYAGVALIVSLIGVSLAILVGRDDFPMSQKFAFVLLLFLVSLPGLLLTLFQLTCLVTGTSRGRTWWCGVYSWFVSVLLIIYSVLLVTVAVMSLASSGKVLEDITRADAEMFKAANQAASNMFTNQQSVDPQMTDADTFASMSSQPAPVAHAQAQPPIERFGGMSEIAAFDDKADQFGDYYESFTDAPADNADLRPAPTASKPAEEAPSQPPTQPTAAPSPAPTRRATAPTATAPTKAPAATD